MATDRDSELKALLRLAWPMMLTQLFIMATGFLDTAMAGHYDKTDLGGVSMAGNIMWPAFMLASGITMALTPIVAQLRGAGDTAAIGARVRQGLWLTTITAALCVAAVLNARPVFELAGVDQSVAAIALEYLAVVAFGIPPLIVYVTLRHVCDGLGQTRPAMFIAGSVLPLNAFLNYVLIYGKLGFPELGGVGCAWATVVVFWAELALMTIVVRRPFFRAARVFERFDPPDLAEIARIVRIGAPIGLSMFLGMALFAVIGIMVGRIGVAELAAHSIAGNLNWLTYVIPMGLGAAAGIRVGFFTGARRLDAARHAGGTAYRFAFAYALIVSLLLVALRHVLVAVYSTDPVVIDVAVTLLLFIAVYQIVDDTQAVAVGALRGYKDTTVPMLYQLVGYWVIALPLGSALAFGWAGLEPLGVYGYWTGMTIGLFLVAVANSARLWRTSRDEARVLRLAAA